MVGGLVLGGGGVCLVLDRWSVGGGVYGVFESGCRYGKRPGRRCQLKMVINRGSRKRENAGSILLVIWVG